MHFMINEGVNMLDILIRNALIVDGTNSPAFVGEVGIKDGKIKCVGKGFHVTCREAKSVVDANGMYLVPGFIDIHSHSDCTILEHPLAESRVFQGITTEITGNCGISSAPVSMDPEKRKLLVDYADIENVTWNSVKEFFDAVEERKVSTNIGLVTGHGTLRIAAMGFDKRKPTEEEMQTMKELLKQSINDGSFGYSSGLIYPPGSYADTDELTELAKVLADYDAIYTTHMRNEGFLVREALAEAIEIAEKSGAALEVSHHKVIRKEVWKNYCFDTIQMIKDANARGVKVYCDQYPYCASSTGLDSNIPLWAFEGGMEAMINRLKDPETKTKIIKEMEESHKGRWCDIYVANAQTEKNQIAVGKNIEEIAKLWEMTPEEACITIVMEENGKSSEVNYGMCEEDIEYIMKQEFTSIGSDGNALSLESSGQPHPRHYGAFVRVLSHYCKKRKLFPLENAIYKLSGQNAEKMGIPNRGKIKEGMWADLVILDLDKIDDTPTYENPKAKCQGIEKVFVNGVLTVDKGNHTGARAGMIVRK